MADLHTPQNPIRLVTASSLFDGHDASINIMRRIFMSQGCEVIHLGHNRSVQEVVDAAIEEDVQGVAVSSYQGGHVEYFENLVQLLREAVEEATAALNGEVFETPGLPEGDVRDLTDRLTALRTGLGDSL